LMEFLSTFSADPNNVADTLKYEEASKQMRSITESII